MSSTRTTAVWLVAGTSRTVEALRRRTVPLNTNRARSVGSRTLALRAMGRASGAPGRDQGAERPKRPSTELRRAAHHPGHDRQRHGREDCRFDAAAAAIGIETEPLLDPVHVVLLRSLRGDDLVGGSPGRNLHHKFCRGEAPWSPEPRV